MSDSTSEILQQAYDLIEEEALEQAQALLSPLLESDADNPALWWVYAHAARDPGIGRAALERVLELDPDYPGARELNADVMALQVPPPSFAPAGDAAALAHSAAAADDDIIDWEALKPAAAEDAPNPGGMRRGIAALLVLAAALVTGAALIASGTVDLSTLLPATSPTPEPVIIVVSDPAEANPAPAEISLEVSASPETEPNAIAATALLTAAAASPVATEMPATPTAPAATATTEATAAPTNALAPEVRALLVLIDSRIPDFAIDIGASNLRSTELGETLIVRVCAISGPEFNERLNTVMQALVAIVSVLPADIEALATGLLNCADPDARLRIVGVPKAMLQQYADGALDERDFQRVWQPLS